MKDEGQKKAHPAVPVAPWIGGKRNLAKRIVSLIDRTPHRTYAEPFVGMGGVFFRRQMQPNTEIINDLGRDVANLFRILQRHYPQFLDTLRFQLTTRAEFERLVATRPETLTDLERAARFLYLQRTAFGGKVASRHFASDGTRPARFNLTRLEPMLEDAHTRLSGVVIECLPADRFIARYDGDGVLFYLDPPYWGSEDVYGKDLFSRDDYQSLADQLGELKGQFILSINDVPEIHEVFKGFAIHPVSTTYGISNRTGATKAAELLIMSEGLADAA